MAAVRPVVSVYDTNGEKASTMKAPAVFTSPLRPDIVDFVASQMQLNTRQAYAVSTNAGYQTAAESWGTGRAVSRIPRVPGGGTHRSGQGAFGNMCRGGGMFNPTKTWRKWHRKIPLTQRRHALASAIAATALPALVMARGHRIEEVPELPLVISDKCESLKKTKEAVAVLKSFGLEAELEATVNSKRVRVGRGKMRNRRYQMKKGPMIVYANDDGCRKAFRNIPGVDTCHVDTMHLLKMAPGGCLGRLVIFTESAFKKLGSIYGTGKIGSSAKKSYTLQKSIMVNSDLHRLINSDEIQSVIRPMKEQGSRFVLKKNALKNKIEMNKLNPGHTHRVMLRRKMTQKGSREFENLQRQKSKRASVHKKQAEVRKGFFTKLTAAYAPKAAPVEADEE